METLQVGAAALSVSILATRTPPQNPFELRHLGCALPNREFERFRRSVCPQEEPMRGDVLETG